jgi:TM2 domain-containing membrane protein YozV
MKNKITAALLAFFLGSFGAHKFYLGQTSKGILFILFIWTTVPSILAFIDFIVFLSMSDEKFNAEYNK